MLLEEKVNFFELEYWKSLYVRHNLDVMHIVKNICESLVDTMLNISGKSKDEVNARLNLVELGLRTDLAPVGYVENELFYHPLAIHCQRKRRNRFVLVWQG